MFLSLCDKVIRISKRCKNADLEFTNSERLVGKLSGRRGQFYKFLRRLRLYKKSLSLKLLKSVVVKKFFELDFTQLLLLLNLSEKKVFYEKTIISTSKMDHPCHHHGCQNLSK